MLSSTTLWLNQRKRHRYFNLHNKIVPASFLVLRLLLLVELGLKLEGVRSACMIVRLLVNTKKEVKPK